MGILSGLGRIIGAGMDLHTQVTNGRMTQGGTRVIPVKDENGNITTGEMKDGRFTTHHPQTKADGTLDNRFGENW